MEWVFVERGLATVLIEIDFKLLLLLTLIAWISSCHSESDPHTLAALSMICCWIISQISLWYLNGIGIGISFHVRRWCPLSI